MRNLVSIASALCYLISGLAFARGLFISKKQAVQLSVSRWAGETDEKNLKLPAVKDRLMQKRYGIVGAIFAVAAFALQIYLTINY